MTTDQVTSFLATLALLAAFAAVAATATVALARTTRNERSVAAAEWMRSAALPLAATVAVIAMLGSLYLSEVAHFLPCKLCWYQRIAMYPLAVILPIAAVRRDRSIKFYALPLAVVGLAVSVWHLIVEHFPSVSGSCDPSNPCTIRWVEQFGFVTIPAMAAMGFLAIIVALVIARPLPVSSPELESTGSPEETS